MEMVPILPMKMIPQIGQNLNSLDMATELDLGKQIVAFIGPEGSGKSSTANRLSYVCQKPYISTGDLIRELAASDRTMLGSGCSVALAEHRYLDPQLMTEILGCRFRQSDTQHGFVLDGALRTLDETTNFPTLLQVSERVMLLTVVYLDIPECMSMERLVTGISARRRTDDTIEGVLKRRTAFNHQLEERLAFIQENWRLLRVDATGPQEEVINQVFSLLAPVQDKLLHATVGIQRN